MLELLMTYMRSVVAKIIVLVGMVSITLLVWLFWGSSPGANSLIGVDGIYAVGIYFLKKNSTSKTDRELASVAGTAGVILLILAFVIAIMLKI